MSCTMTTLPTEVAHCSEQNGNELPASEPFAQENRAEQNVHERCHEIPKTCLNDATDDYGPDVQEPSDRDHRTACQTIESGASRPNARCDFGPAALPREQRD